MMAYWTRVAAGGRPDPSGAPAWPRFDAARPASMLFRAGTAVPSGDPMGLAYGLHDRWIARLRADGGRRWDWSQTGPAARPLGGQ